jgi:hypothetical protein
LAESQDAVEELCGLSGEGDADQEARDALLTEDVARRLANGSFREAAALFEQVRVPKHDAWALRVGLHVNHDLEIDGVFSLSRPSAQGGTFFDHDMLI